MLGAYYQLKLYDNEHSLIQQTEIKESRSFVENFLKMHYNYLNDETNITQIDITNTARSIVYSPPNGVCVHQGGDGDQLIFGCTVGSGLASDKLGIILGTDDTAVTSTDYVLSSPIAHGTNVGEIEYLSCYGRAFSINTTTDEGTFNIERIFRNSSGSAGTLEIKEIGIYTLLASSTDNMYSILVIRDIISPSQSVADGEYLKVIYTFKITA